jgi:putative flippase GtrA
VVDTQNLGTSPSPRDRAQPQQRRTSVAREALSSAIRSRLATFHTGHRHSLKARLSRYAAGSVIAASLSELTFLVVFGVGHAPAVVATVVAFLAGAVPNWVLNRRWAWSRSDRVSPRRELVPYIAIVAATLIATIAGTAVAEAAAHNLSHWLAVAVVDGAFVVITGAMFVIKFVLFDRVVFI